MADYIGSLVSTKQECYNHALLPAYVAAWLSNYHPNVVKIIEDSIDYFIEQYGIADDVQLTQKLGLTMDQLKTYLEPCALWPKVAFVLTHARNQEMEQDILDWLNDALNVCLNKGGIESDEHIINTILAEFLSTAYACNMIMFVELAQADALTPIQTENCQAFIQSCSENEVPIQVGLTLRLVFVAGRCNMLHAFNLIKQHTTAITAQNPELGNDREDLYQLMNLIGNGLVELKQTSLNKAMRTLEFVLKSTAEFFECGNTETILNAYQSLDDDAKRSIVQRWYTCMKPIIMDLKAYVDLADDFDDAWQKGEIEAPTEVMMIRLEVMPTIKSLFGKISQRLPTIVKDLDIADKIEQLLSTGPFLENVECKSYIRMLHALNVHALKYHQYSTYDQLEHRLLNVGDDEIENPNNVEGFFTEFIKSTINDMPHLSQRRMIWYITLVVKQLLSVLNSESFLKANTDFNPDMVYKSADIGKGLHTLSHYLREMMDIDLMNDIMVSDDEAVVTNMSEDMSLDQVEDQAF